MNPTARAQLEAVRDEWLAPLVAQITEQAERIGRLEAERDELRARLDAAQAAPAPPGATGAAGASVSTPPVWRRLLRALRVR